MPDETLANFREYVSRLFSLSTDDPNLGVSLADDAISAVNSYASGRLTWDEFVSQSEAIIRAVE